MRTYPIYKDENLEKEIERLLIQSWQEDTRFYKLLLKDLDLSFVTEKGKLTISVKLFSAGSMGFIAEVSNYPYVLTAENKNGRVECVWQKNGKLDN